MKIAIDSNPLVSGHRVRGVGVYTRETLEALKKATKGRKDIKIVPLDFSTQNSKLKTQNFDLIHYPYFHPYFLTLPFRKQAKIIVTIHDTIPLIYPKQYPPGIRGKFKFKLQKFLINRVDGVIAPSETSKKDVVRFLGVHQEKIKVIYEAPREIFKLITDNRKLKTATRKYDLPKRFALYLGDVNYNKNLLNLAEACNIAKIPLVLVGKQTTDKSIDLSHVENQSYAEFLNRYSKDSNMLRLGFVPDEDLVAIFNLASVYCQPSFYEGFGLSILEAMACGTAVVCAKTQALVEIAGDAALFVDPHKPKDIAKKLGEIVKISQTKEDLVKKGFARVKEFSWEKAAKETIDYYKLIING